MPSTFDKLNTVGCRRPVDYLSISQKHVLLIERRSGWLSRQDLGLQILWSWVPYLRFIPVNVAFPVTLRLGARGVPASRGLGKSRKYWPTNAKVCLETETPQLYSSNYIRFSVGKNRDNRYHQNLFSANHLSLDKLILWGRFGINFLFRFLDPSLTINAFFSRGRC
jgi:hypothetical protein